MPELQGERCVLLGVVAHVHGRQLPQFLFGVHTEVGRGLLQALFRFDFFEVVKAQAVQAVGIAVLVQHRCCQHGVVDRAVYLKSRGSEPSEVVGCVVHDLVCGCSQDVANPALHDALVQIPTASVSDRKIASPTVNSNSVTDNVAIISRPTRTQALHVRVTGFEVNCNLLSFTKIRKRGRWQPLGNPRKHRQRFSFALHSLKPFCSFFGSTMCSVCLARVMPTYSRRLMSSEFFS